FAGLMDTLDVLPPEIKTDHDREQRRERVVGNVDVVPEVMESIGKKACEVLASRHCADWPGEHVIEQQRGNRQLGQLSAHGLLDYAIDAAANEHGTGFDIQRPHRIAEQ